MTKKTFSAAINEAIVHVMEIDSSVICYGLGVTDPKGVFDTTSNLEKDFGSERVFDMPTSEINDRCCNWRCIKRYKICSDSPKSRFFSIGNGSAN